MEAHSWFWLTCDLWLLRFVLSFDFDLGVLDVASDVASRVLFVLSSVDRLETRRSFFLGLAVDLFI